MVGLGGGAFSYERGTPVRLLDSGRCEDLEPREAIGALSSDCVLRNGNRCKIPYRNKVCKVSVGRKCKVHTPKTGVYLNVLYLELTSGKLCSALTGVFACKLARKRMRKRVEAGGVATYMDYSKLGTRTA